MNVHPFFWEQRFYVSPKGFIIQKIFHINISIYFLTSFLYNRLTNVFCFLNLLQSSVSLVLWYFVSSSDLFIIAFLNHCLLETKTTIRQEKIIATWVIRRLLTRLLSSYSAQARFCLHCIKISDKMKHFVFLKFNSTKNPSLSSYRLCLP